MLFPSDTKLNIRFKRKNMFRETTVHVWDIVTIHSRLLYTIPGTLNTRYRFYWVSHGHKQHHKFLYHWAWKASWSTAVFKNPILQSPLSLICQTNLWIENVSGMDGAWWMLSGSTISSDFGKYTVIIDSTSFMATSENSLGLWTTIWPDFPFRKMTFWMVPPTSFIGTLPWCPSL